MSKASNSLKTSDVLVTPIKLKYQTSIASSSLENYGIKVLTGVNGPVSTTGNISQEVLNYMSVKHLYYSNYLTGSLQVSASGFDNWLQSTAAFKGDPPAPKVPSTARARASVLDYGAVGDGTTNDTAAIQRAINENEYVYIPTGNYLVDTITLRTNSNILGDGSSASRLTRTNNYDPTLGQYRDALIYVDSHSSTTQVDNVTISSICLDGKVEDYGFSEQTHLMWFVGVSNLNILNVKFLGYRGDGLYFGGVGYGSVYTDFTPRHNKNANVVNCIFDGVNNDNRNGVSVIDGTNIAIDGCSFKNSTKTNMPGAIDFEPDNTYNIIQNNTVINCTFDNINSAIFAISTVQWTNVDGHPDQGDTVPYTVFPNGFTFENNTVTNCSAATMLFYTYQVSAPFNTSYIADNQAVCNITFSNNTCSNGAKPFFLTNANGVVFENNTFTDFNDVGYMSFPVRGYITCRNIQINNSTFTRCGTGTYSWPFYPDGGYDVNFRSPNGTAIRIYNIDTLTISGNEFIDCGNGTTPASAIEFFEGNWYYYNNNGKTSQLSGGPDQSYNININNNVFTTPTGKTKYAINIGAKWSAQGYHYKFNSTTNQFYDNTLNGLPYVFDTVNVKDYATGNGVTDDTAGIQAAIDRAVLIGMNKIYFPAGTYMITRGFPLMDDMIVYGDGATSLLKMISGTGTRTDEKTQTSIFVGNNAYSLSGPSSLNSTNNITIRDLAMNLQKPAGVYNQSAFSMFGGVRLINPVNCTIDNVTILNQQVFGVGLYATQDGESCANNTVQNCTITMEPYWYNPGYGPNDVGPAYIQPGIFTSSSIGIELSSYIGPHNNGTTIYLSRNNPDYVASKTQNNTIQNNTISGGSHGISVTNSKYNTIHGNSLTGCSHRGILTAACSDYNTYEENTATNIGSTGIHFAYNCEHNLINNNTVNTVYGVEGDGIKAYVNCNYNTFTNNNVSNAYISGIRVAHGANYNTIKNNTITGNYVSSVVQKGIKILANTYAQYINNGLTFSNQLTAHDNICTDNIISSVYLGVAVGDEMTATVGPGKAYNNTVSNNTYINYNTKENLNVTSTSY